MSADKLDLDTVQRDPGRHFAEPQDIVDAAGLDRVTKLKLLEEWERDARALSVAEDEGLSGGEAPMLARIRHARRALADDEPAAKGTTKHG
jgi:hypothetical protein